MLLEYDRGDHVGCRRIAASSAWDTAICSLLEERTGGASAARNNSGVVESHSAPAAFGSWATPLAAN